MATELAFITASPLNTAWVLSQKLLNTIEIKVVLDNPRFLTHASAYSVEPSSKQGPNAAHAPTYANFRQAYLKFQKKKEERKKKTGISHFQTTASVPVTAD